MMPKPRIQKIGVPSEKSIRVLHNDVAGILSGEAGLNRRSQACMKNTSAARKTSVQPASIDGKFRKYLF